MESGSIHLALFIKNLKEEKKEMIIRAGGNERRTKHSGVFHAYKMSSKSVRPFVSPNVTVHSLYK